MIKFPSSLRSLWFTCNSLVPPSNLSFQQYQELSSLQQGQCLAQLKGKYPLHALGFWQGDISSGCFCQTFPFHIACNSDLFYYHPHMAHHTPTFGPMALPIREALIKFLCFGPENMDMVYWSKSPLQKCSVDDKENYGFSLVCLMKNGHKSHTTVRAQSQNKKKRKWPEKYPNQNFILPFTAPGR